MPELTALMTLDSVDGPNLLNSTYSTASSSSSTLSTSASAGALLLHPVVAFKLSTSLPTVVGLLACIVEVLERISHMDLLQACRKLI